MNSLFILLVTENYDKGEWFERALSVSSMEVFEKGFEIRSGKIMLHASIHTRYSLDVYSPIQWSTRDDG